eukprot:1532895-Pyramimonas_sp.AAC.1
MGCGSGAWADGGRSTHPFITAVTPWAASNIGHPPSSDKLLGRFSRAPLCRELLCGPKGPEPLGGCSSSGMGPRIPAVL